MYSKMLLLKCHASVYFYVLVTLSVVSWFIMYSSARTEHRVAHKASKYKIVRTPNTNIRDGLIQCAVEGNELTLYAVMDTSGRCETVGAEKNTDITETAIFLHKESFKLLLNPEYYPPILNDHYEYNEIYPPGGLDINLHIRLQITVEKDWSKLGFNFGPTKEIETGGDVYFSVDIRPDALTLNRRINEKWETEVKYNVTKLFTANQQFTMEISHADRITRVIFDGKTDYKYTANTAWKGASFISIFADPLLVCRLHSVEFLSPPTVA